MSVVHPSGPIQKVHPTLSPSLTHTLRKKPVPYSPFSQAHNKQLQPTQSLAPLQTELKKNRTWNRETWACTRATRTWSWTWTELQAWTCSCFTWQYWKSSFLLLHNACIICPVKGVSDPELDEQELIIQDINKKILKW